MRRTEKLQVLRNVVVAVANYRAEHKCPAPDDVMFGAAALALQTTDLTKAKAFLSECTREDYAAATKIIEREIHMRDSRNG